MDGLPVSERLPHSDNLSNEDYELLVHQVMRDMLQQMYYLRLEMQLALDDCTQDAPKPHQATESIQIAIRRTYRINQIISQIYEDDL